MGSTVPPPSSLLQKGAGKCKDKQGQKRCLRVRDSRSSVLLRYQRGEEVDVTYLPTDVTCQHQHEEEKLDNGSSAASQTEV